MQAIEDGHAGTVGGLGIAKQLPGPVGRQIEGVEFKGDLLRCYVN